MSPTPQSRLAVNPASDQAIEDERQNMSEPTCINLAERFGHLYRTGWEATGATKGQWPREDWPWLMEIRCRHGIVAPFGGEILQGMTSKPRIGRLLRQLPVVLHARGDEETVIRFHVDNIDLVLGLLKPYRRRTLSAARKTAAVEHLKALREGRKSLPQGGHSALESTNGTAEPIGTGNAHAG